MAKRNQIHSEKKSQKRMKTISCILCVVMVLAVVTGFVPMAKMNAYANEGTEITNSTTGNLASGTYYLSGDVTLSGTLTLGDGVIINGNGHTISYASGTVLTASRDCCIKLNNLIIGNSGGNNVSGSALVVNSGATAILDNCKITGNNYQYSAAIKLYGNVVLDKCEIADNETKASGAGGVIEMGSNSCFYANETTIKNNKAGQHTGGLNNGSGKAYLMKCRITGNTSMGSGYANSLGGGIRSGTNLYAANCVITGNKSGTGTNDNLDIGGSPTLVKCIYGQITGNTNVTGCTVSSDANAALPSAPAYFSYSYNSGLNVRMSYMDTNNSLQPLGDLQNVEPTVTSIPVANTLTFNGNEQTLISAGTVNFGDMKYAVTTNDTQPGDTEYTYNNDSLPAKKEAGTYYVWYKAVYLNVSSTPGKITATIEPKSLSTATITLDGNEFNYDGSQKRVNVTSVKLGDAVLDQSADYDVSGDLSATDSGTYTVTITGKGNYKDSVTTEWKINTSGETIPDPSSEAVSISSAVVTLSSTTFEYSGTEKTVSVTSVKLGDTLLTENDYDIGGTLKATEAGTYTVTVTGKGSYKDSASATWTIVSSQGTTEAKIENQDNSVPESKVEGFSNAVAMSVATDDEKTQINAGAKSQFVVEMKNIDSTVSETDKQLTENAVKGENQNAVVAMYVDMSVFFQVGSAAKRQLTTLNGNTVSFLFKVPEKYKAPVGTKRTFYITRIHNGIGAVIARSASMEIPFTTGDFSTYAIAYSDEPEVTGQFFTSVSVKQKNGKLNISWNKTDAKKVEVYITYCGNDFNDKPAKTTTGTSVSLKKIGGKKINFTKNMKLYLVGYGSSGQRIGRTVTAHIVGKDHKTFTNVKSIKLKNPAVTLTKGQSSKITATLKLEDKTKKMVSEDHVAKLRYRTTNRNVATVDENGNITGAGAGTCDVYVIAGNGLAKKVKVTVTE